jgi:hypothetical protein
MDIFGKILRPQFNVTVFNKNVFLTMNQKFVENLVEFISQDEKLRNDFEDLIDCLKAIIADEQNFYENDSGEFNCSKFQSIFHLSMLQDFCLALSENILELAGGICSKNKNLDLNAFVAFGKKLESAGQGNYMSLNNRTKGVREIIIRKEYVR